MVDYTVDLIVFGISKYQNKNIRELLKKKLSVILLNREKEPFKNYYCLPGGYVKENETAEDLADAIIYILNHPEEVETMKRNSYMATVNSYNWEKFESIFRQMF